MILEALSNAFGPSGCEQDVRTLVLEQLRDRVDCCRVDHLGNVLALQRGTSEGLKVMVAAHMDEVGLMVTHADEAGFLRFVTVGGIDARVLPAKRVIVGKERLPGVIAVKPVHKTTADERSRAMPIEQLVIDIGASGKAEAEKLVGKGEYAVFATRFQDLGGVVVGKAFDDRAGCAMLIELVRRGPYPFAFHPVFTTMEEIGMRGARVAAFAVAPDLAFVLEGTICDDSPKKRDESPTTELGKGPVISVADRSVMADPRLVRHVLRTAQEMGLPCQIKQPGKGATDAGAIHLARIGVPSLPVCVACRYIHSPTAMLSKRDLGQTVDLLEQSLRRLTPEVLAEADRALERCSP
jgi:endoglucanase